MGDAKRQKTEMKKIEKVEKEESGSVNFAELRDDLFREAAKLVSAVPSTKIAVFVTAPPSSESDVSMYAFGNPSASGVVKTFLEDNRPVPVPVDADAEDDAEDEDDEEEEDEDDAEDGSSQGFWWEDAKQFESMNPEQLDAAYDKMTRLRDHMILELDARLKAEGSSGNQQDLHNNDKAQPKP